MFHRFHNKIAIAHPDWLFSVVQREVRFHYQWVVLNDFLPTIIDHAVLTHVLPHLKHRGGNIVTHKPNLEFFHWVRGPFMPLEFSAAAYRFGHSMVRPGYRLSETIGPLPIFGTDINAR
jgi:Animal haem peroxidase.